MSYPSDYTAPEKAQVKRSLGFCDALEWNVTARDLKNAVRDERKHSALAYAVDIERRALALLANAQA